MNPCEEYELLLSARLDGALSLKEETQLHAHLAQCPHCRQLAQELEDLQTQMTSLWVEPPDSLKDALARLLFPAPFPNGFPLQATALASVAGLRCGRRGAGCGPLPASPARGSRWTPAKGSH